MKKPSKNKRYYAENRKKLRENEFVKQNKNLTNKTERSVPEYLSTKTKSKKNQTTLRIAKRSRNRNEESQVRPQHNTTATPS